VISSIDINLVRGILLILLILAFFGIWAWAWQSKQKPAFREASMLPLEEDDGRIPGLEASATSQSASASASASASGEPVSTQEKSSESDLC
jgi:cytochrome c oxidase cbb3-type subunit 4